MQLDALGWHTRHVRVAVVAEWYPSPADPVHGIWAHRQAVAAARYGAEVRVLALRRPVPPLALARRLTLRPSDWQALQAWTMGTRAALKPATVDGIDVVPVPWLGPPRPLSYGAWGYWMAPSLYRALERLYAAWPFDLVHAHCIAPAGHAAALWIDGTPAWLRPIRTHLARDGQGLKRSATGRPAFVVSAHGPDMIHVPERSRIGRRACLTALETADVVLANSNWAKRRCEQIAERALPVSVVHLGADLSDQPSMHRNGEMRIVTVAHLQARKRHDVVLRALARLDPSRRPRYLIIGDGEQRDSLERLAVELGVADRVRFLGQLPNEQAVAQVAASDLFVMPGVEEPFGVAFVEAMAAGVAVIGGRGEGGPEDIAAVGEGMLMVTPGDVDELAGELARLYANRLELRRLGAAARATAAANFTWDRCGTLTVAAYRDALAARDRSIHGRGRRPGNARSGTDDREGARR
jgi:teichuronic acid biosynthesis glycosyltransferase TuaC